MPYKAVTSRSKSSGSAPQGQKPPTPATPLNQHKQLAGCNGAGKKS